MAAVTTELKVVVKAAGQQDISKLDAALNKLAVTARTKVDNNFKRVATQLKEVQKTSKNSIQNLRDYRNAWRDISAQLEIGSKEFKEARLEAEKLDKQLQKAEGRRPQGSRLGRAARGVGAIAAGGVFGGVEGAVGGAIGLIGGPAAAAVGAAIGAQVGNFRRAAGAGAEYAASLRKLRIALFGVTESQEQYQNSLKFITQTTKDFAIPQDVVTRQFTKLQASVQGAGGNIEDTKTAFNGIVAAVRATGGSLADVDSALTATAQVFSKGKVSAEELRQQIGERLPGAFTLFAQSIGKTPQELDKALEKGQVSLQDFQTFAESLFDRYGETAQEISRAPEAAGDRLKVVLQELNESVGTLLKPIGAAFQETFIDIVNSINGAIKALNVFLGIGQQGLERRLRDINQRLAKLPGTDVSPQAAGRAGAIDFLRSRDRLLSERAKVQAELDKINEFNVKQAEAGGGLPGIPQNNTSVSAGGGRSGGGGRSTRQPMGEAEFVLRQRINNARDQELGYAKAIAEFDLRIFEINTKIVNDPFKRLDEFRKAEITLKERIAKLDEQAVKQAEKLEEARIDSFKAIFKQAAEIDRLIPKTTELGKLWKDIGQSIQNGVAGAIEDAIFGAKSLQESLTGILKSVASLLIQFGTKSLFSAAGFSFAEGGVMTKKGPLDLKTYARGGIANSPQLAMFGEGSMPEAYVPLPDGRSIPVTMQGGGNRVNVGSVNITVENTGEDLQPAAQKELAAQVRGLVLTTLADEKRSGGLLR